MSEKPLASAAMTSEIDGQFRAHLTRSDGQEDLSFALFHPSTGRRRFSALVVEPVLPLEGDRQVHGNVSFNPTYFERVLAEALDRQMGIALLHSHPGAQGWQALSDDDWEAEAGMAGAVRSGTGLPLVGLTLATADGHWSARHWHRVKDEAWSPRYCEHVRVVGAQLGVSRCPHVRPRKTLPPTLTRTVHAWGPALHEQLSTLRLGVVGVGSVGSVVVEALARMGFSELVLIDRDQIRQINLDRTLHAYNENATVGDFKAALAARSASRSASQPGIQVTPLCSGLEELDAYRAALDCDALFSCVDRPWPRSILNHVAYANLIPVIDGGIEVSRKPQGGLRSADWGTFVVGPGRRCLECAGQFESGLVAVERGGDLDDPRYMESLPADSPLRPRENVFVFSSALASLEVLRLIQLVGKPGGIAAPDEERYSFPSSNVEIRDGEACHPNCVARSIVGRGDHAGHPGINDWP